MPTPEKLSARLAGKDAKEQADIKSKEIAKLSLTGEYTKDNLRVRILSLTEIEGGIEIMAQAWDGTKQLGFGADGSVDIERFRIYNPPILTYDPDGDIVRSWTDKKGVARQKNLKEDMAAAIQHVLADVIQLTAREGQIVEGKIGHTVSTFYPDPNIEASSVDGAVSNDGIASWATCRSATAGNVVSDSTALETFAGATRDSPTVYYIRRGFVLFNTAALPDTDVISSAVLTFKGSERWGSTDSQSYIALVAGTPASNTAIVTGDFDQIGTVKLANDVTMPNGYDSTDTDLAFTLNATGIAAVAMTGVSKFATVSGYDFENVAIDTNGKIAQFSAYAAETATTTFDPKLVITHAAPAAGGRQNRLSLLGVA